MDDNRITDKDIFEGELNDLFSDCYRMKAYFMDAMGDLFWRYLSVCKDSGASLKDELVLEYFGKYKNRLAFILPEAVQDFKIMKSKKGKPDLTLIK